jgi:site-specific DNA-methyltransferase (adenine-specific)
MTNITWEQIVIPIKELKEYEHNPRKISKTAFEKLVAHILEDGYHNRILVNADNTIIGGHARKKALLAAGYTVDQNIAVLKANRFLQERELKRLNIRDNLDIFGEFDMDILANCFEIKDLIDWGMDPNLFPEVEPEVTEQDNEAIPSNSSSSIILGDMFELGDHRLLCGDSTSASDVIKLLSGNIPNLMVTDPPYGVQYEPEWRDGHDLGSAERATGKVANDDKVEWTEAYSLFPGSVAYVWHAGKYSNIVQNNLENCGFELINQIIWVKQHFAMSRGDYHWQHEPCHYVVKKGQKHNWQGARDQSTTWQIKNNNSFGNSDKEETFGHSTQKPIECMLKPIINNSSKGDYIYDPFGGSGTTLIASEKTGRNCLMMEILPEYCQMIIDRWEKHTGKKASKC